MEAAISKDLGEFKYQRKLLCKLVFAFIFFFLLYYLYSNTMVHQLHSPVLIFPYVDITYWLFHSLKITEFITHNYFISCCFDVLLFASCVLSFLFPGKRFFVIAFFVLYCIYYIIFNSYGTQHTHSKAGILLMPLPFMVPKKMFYYMWEAMRYFSLFVYADAFLWKLFRVNFLIGDHGSLVIKKNFAAYLYYHPYGFLADMYTWLFKHPGIIQIIFITGFIMEGCFVTGFFTKRFDRYLLVLSILLPVGFRLLSDAFFFELLILSFTLLNFRMLSKPVRQQGTTWRSG